MLVLSRREQETIVLPAIRTTIQILKVRGQVTRVGIDAPERVQILRGEIAQDPGGGKHATQEDLFTQLHALRNRLHYAGLHARFAAKLLESGQLQEAREALENLIGAVHQSEQASDVQSSAEPRQRPRTLLVEDNANERHLMAGILRASGFEVEVAGDGAEALDHLEGSFYPDVVLMDMMMPGCDGPTAVRRIRNTPQWQGLKIYAISGSTQQDAGLEMGPRGVDRWYSKPLDPDRLVSELTRELLASG